jgi:hypothetical protein
MRNKVILCPHKDRAGNHEAAAKALQGVASQVQGPPQKCKGVDYDCLSDAKNEKIKKQVLSSMANSSMKDTDASTITDDSNQ